MLGHWCLFEQLAIGVTTDDVTANSRCDCVFYKRRILLGLAKFDVESMLASGARYGVRGEVLLQADYGQGDCVW